MASRLDRERFLIGSCQRLLQTVALLSHLCRPVRSTFAVRETLGIMGAPRVPPTGQHKWVNETYDAAMWFTDTLNVVPESFYDKYFNLDLRTNICRRSRVGCYCFP